MSPRPTILLDLDGTVIVGHGPVLAYARAAARLGGLDDGFVDAVDAELAAVGAGQHGAGGHGAGRHDAGRLGDDRALDGYDLVRIHAAAAGIASATLAEAYLESRSVLGRAEAPVTVPDGLADFLASVDADRVLVTNAPAVGVHEALAALGLADHFDRIVTEAGKPAGLALVLDELDAAGSPVIAVGDIWRNDLAPAHERGHATALVGTFDDPEATPTFRAERLERLLPSIAAWIEERPASPGASVSRRLPVPSRPRSTVTATE